MATTEAYASLFTGDELDYAIANMLGNKYRGTISPGCHLIGVSVETRIDLDTLLIDGKYTIYHYINGPAAFLTEENGTSYEEYDPDTSTDDDAPISRLTDQGAFTVKPIFIQVYHTGGDHLYQTIMVGAKLYWRDMYSAENIIEYDDGQGHRYVHIPWRSVDLGIESSVIESSFEKMYNGNDISLSQRMGTAAIDYVRRLAIGNANLLDFTNGFFMYSLKDDPLEVDNEMAKYWSMSNGHIETKTYSQIAIDFDISKMPLFDDIDDEIMSLFYTDGANAAFANYYTDNNNNKIINPIDVSAKAPYTASVYLLYDVNFIEEADDAVAYISIGYLNSENTRVTKTSTIKLNRLASAAEYDPPVPADIECGNDIYEGTVYANEGPDSDSEFKRYDVSASQRGYYRLKVTIDTNDISNSQYSSISVAFGVSNVVRSVQHVVFALPKVEYGVYATQYNHSWGDLYYYFTNCESFFGVPIDLDHPKNFKLHDGFIFGGWRCNTCGYEGAKETFTDYTTNSPTCPECDSGDITYDHFNVEPLAIGGGGGFVQHTEDDLSIKTDNDSYDYNSKYIVYHDENSSNEYHGTNDEDYLPISYCPDGISTVTGYDQDIYNPYEGNDVLAEKYPRYKYVLFFNKQTTELMCWDDLYKNFDTDNLGGLVSINKTFVIRERGDNANGPKPVDYSTDRSYVESYVGKNRFWIDNTGVDYSGDDNKAGLLKYWDPEAQMWLSPKTEPTSIYVVQPNAPDRSWAGKLWINSTTGVMYYYDNTAIPAVWKPVYAAWGSNPTA